MRNLPRLLIPITMLMLMFASCESEQTVSDSSSITCIEDLIGHKVAVPTGTPYDLLLSAIPGIELVRLGIPEMPLSVQTGQAEYCIFNTLQANAMNLKAQGLVSVLDGIMGDVDVGMAFPKSDEGIRLRDLFNDFLKEFKACGDYERLFEAWETDSELASNALMELERQLPTSGKTIAVGAFFEMFPFVYIKDGHYSGIEVEMMYRFSIWSGIRVEYSHYDFNALVPAVVTGKVDMAHSHLMITEEREKQVFFSDATMPNEASCLALASNAGSKKRIEKNEDLIGYSVAVPAGGTQDLVLSQIPGIDLLRVSVTETMLMVETGKADCCMIERLQAAQGRYCERGLEKWGEGFFRGSAGIAFRKEDTLFQQSFNKFLADFRANGEYDKLVRDWESNIDSMALESVRRRPPYSEGEKKVIGTTIVAPSIFLLESEFTGLEIDLFNRFSIATKTPIEYKVVDFAAAIPALNAGQFDAFLSRLRITEERSKMVLFSDEYLETELIVLRRAGSDSAVTRPSFWQRIKDSFNRNLVEEHRWLYMLQGLWQTIQISLFSVLTGIVAGAALCLCRKSRSRILSGFAAAIVEIFRAVPLVVVLMMMAYVILASARIDPLWIAVISFSVYFGSYFCEIFRAGIDSVDVLQWEAGFVLGFSKFNTFRLIILPQAISRIIPVFRGMVIKLMKSTSVVGYVAIIDLTKSGDIIRARTLDPFFPLVIVAIVYLLLTILLNRLFRIFASGSRRG